MTLTKEYSLQPRTLRSISRHDIGCHYSSLTDYLDKVVGYRPSMLKKIDCLIAKFHLGAVGKLDDGHYGTVLPRIDRKGNIMSGSIIYFDYDDGSVLHAESLTDNLCHYPFSDYVVDNDVFFGEHTLSVRPVAVVSEEKTALLGALAEYPVDWIAIGYGREPTRRMMDKVYGRQVVMFPDGLYAQEWEDVFGDKFKVDTSFTHQDINRYLVERIQSRLAP